MTGKSRTWKVILLTPLHIGDGVELQRDMDYLVEGQKLRVMDTEAVLDQMADYPGAIREVGQSGFNLGRLIRDYGVSESPVYDLPLSSGEPPQSLRNFVKDAFGRPFLPGSSLKGSLRTALWTGLDRSGAPTPSSFRNFNDFRQFQKNVGHVSGTAPHYDFLRPLQVSDSPGIPPKGALMAQEIKFLNLRGENRPGWKSFEGRGNPTRDRFQDAVGIFVEALRTNTEFILKCGLDAFFREDWVQSTLNLPKSGGLANYSDLSRAVNEHSLQIARRELGFFSSLGGDTAPVSGFYRQIVSGIEGLLPDNPTFITRLAWGSGWRGMTGDWLTDVELNAVRSQVNLGKRGASVFPKTRRLAMANGVPSLPMGWVVVSPEEDKAFSGAERIPGWVFQPEKEEANSQAALLGSQEGGKEKVEETPVPQPPPEPPPPEPELETQEWPDCHLKWEPGKSIIVATGQGEFSGKKAETDDKEIVPEKFRKKLFKNKKPIFATAIVSPYGNSFRLISIKE